jgi:hypothetical protein
MDIFKALEAVTNTLGNVEVKGRDNLDKLLGSIIMIEKVRDALRDAQKGAENDATD